MNIILTPKSYKLIINFTVLSILVMPLFAIANDNFPDRAVSNENEEQEYTTQITPPETSERNNGMQPAERPVEAMPISENQRELRKQAMRQRFEQHVRENLPDRQQQAALRAAEGISQSNQRLSRQYLRHLDLMTSILIKITDRAHILKNNGLEMNEVDEAVTAAKRLLAVASDKAEQQLNKEYIVDVETTDNIGQALRTTVQELRRDHESLRQTELSQAREAVKEAFLILKRLAEPSSPITPNNAATPPGKITSFEECKEAGYPVMESYPARCAVPGGETFTEDITDETNI